MVGTFHPVARPFTHTPVLCSSSFHVEGHPLEAPADFRAKLDGLMEGHTEHESQRKAALAFLYLIAVLAPPTTEQGLVLRARSTLPVGAGLGSSASFSAAMATALLLTFGHITSATDPASLETINAYAFMAEQVIHGNPSGLDNSVATFGGARSFRRGGAFETLEGFQSLDLLLTNTKVPRSTSVLVAGVGAKKTTYPTIVEPMLDAIDQISARCKDAFLRRKQNAISQEELLAELEDLVDINHCLLHGLGVSHASLEQVRAITGEHGIKTKLTGAGGGGCALSIVPHGLPQADIETVKAQLANVGYDCYQTSLGGLGVTTSVLNPDQDEKWLMEASREDLEARILLA